MYPVSKEYSSRMRSTIREAVAEATVYLGVFDKTASGDAALTPPATAFYSQPDKIIQPNNINTSYTTFEGNGFRLDGGQRLLPATTAALFAQGFVGKELADKNGHFANSQTIEVNFGVYHDMAGITLEFDGLFPLPREVVVTGYSNDAVVAEALVYPTSKETQLRISLEKINKLTIEFVKVEPFGRARINTIKFGIGYSFSGSRLISTEEKHQGSPVTLSLPVSSFEFSIYNEDNMFGVDDDSALSAFLTEGQEASVDYLVSWYGGSQKIPGGVWYLKSWTVDRFKADFKLENCLADLNNTTYYKGVFDNKTRTLYELAEAVFNDAGISNYYIDAHLLEVSTKAPVPIITHGEALQLIANAARARLFVDREGKICIETIVDVPPKPFLYEFDKQEYYSDVESVLDSNNVEYLTFENKFARLDGTQTLLPENDKDLLSAGWVGKGLSAASKTDSSVFAYAEDGNAIRLAYEAPTNVFSITINWGGVIPKQASIVAQTEEGWETETIILPTKNIERYAVSIRHCAQIDIRLNVADRENVRARILSIEAGQLSDFTLEKNQLFESSTGSIEVKLKNVSTKWTSRSVASEVSEITRQTVTANGNIIVIQHPLGCNMSVSVEKDGVPINTATVNAEHYAYISYISVLSNTEDEVDVVLRGKTVSESDVFVSSVANSNGETLEIYNPLFDSADVAQTVADWIREYYSRRVVYDYNTRGFPELEYGDTIYLDNGYSAVITNLELVYNGAFSNNIRLRR